MKQNSILIFVAVMNLLIFTFVAAMVYDMEGTLGGDEGGSDGTSDDTSDGTGTDEVFHQYFAKIGTIKGDSKDKDHREWIEILSYSHGVSTSGTVLDTDTDESSPFIITKNVDGSSPMLKNASRNRTFGKPVIIHAVRANRSDEDDRDHYLTIELLDVIVTSVSTGGSGRPDDQEQNSPEVETVILKFGSISWTYENQNITITEDGNFPVDDDPIDTEDEEDIVFLYPEYNPLTQIDNLPDQPISVISLDWGMASAIPPKGLKMSDVDPYEPITFTKEIDEHSPILYQLLGSGGTLNGTIEVQRPPETASDVPQTYFTIQFFDGRIASIETGSDSEGGRTVGSGSITDIIEVTWGRIVMTWTGDSLDTTYEVSQDELQAEVDHYSVDTFLTISKLPDRNEVLNEGTMVTIEDIPLFEFDHQISQSIDLANGLPDGTSEHSFVEITKDVDESTPLLYHALLNGDTFQLRTRFYRIKAERPSPDDPELEEYKVITFTNASVQSITTVEDDNGWEQHREREHVAFCYQKITWEFWDGGITASDDWETPVA